MGNTPPPAPDQQNPSALDEMRDSAEKFVNEITRQGNIELRGPEVFYLIDKDIVDLLRQPMAALGLPIEPEPVRLHDYDPNYFYYVYRVPLAEGYLALIYLRNRVTEQYQPSNNLPQILDWATGVPENLKHDIQAICFLTDGESIQRTFKNIANSWIAQQRVRYADFVEGPVIEGLRSASDPEIRRITLAGIFNHSELTPRPVPADAGALGLNEQQANLTVDDLDNDPEKKNRLVTIFKNYFTDSLPAVSVTMRASNLIDSTNWSEAWKEDRKNALTDNAETDARNLLERAIYLQYFTPTAGTGRQSALLSLLQRVQPTLRENDQRFIDELVEYFNL